MSLQIALISNSQTVFGFEIAGIKNMADDQTVFSLENDCEANAISEIFEKLIKREDIAIIFISSNHATKIQDYIRNCNSIPSICIIPFRQ